MLGEGISAQQALWRADAEDKATVGREGLRGVVPPRAPAGTCGPLYDARPPTHVASDDFHQRARADDLMDQSAQPQERAATCDGERIFVVLSEAHMPTSRDVFPNVSLNTVALVAERIHANNDLGGRRRHITESSARHLCQSNVNRMCNAA